MSTGIERWEAAFDGYTDLLEADWGAVMRAADPDLWRSWGEDDAACNAKSAFEEAAEDRGVGSVILDFPNSTHGDGATVTIYRLPGGTAVIARRATVESDQPSGIVLRGNDPDEMLAKADALLFCDGYPDGTLQDLDESSEYDADAIATIEGVKALRARWIALTGR